MDLHASTWTDADAAETDIAFIPVGSTEQHGPHGPLGTDFLAAEAVASETADRVDREVMVTPPMPVGVSEEHRQFTGTLWVSPDTFRSYVREVAESLLHHGWNRIVLVNGHGGNVRAIGEVAARLSRAEDALVVPFTWFEAVDGAFDMGHAGPLETSFLLHTQPELVETDRLDAGRDGGTDRWGEWVSGTNVAHDSAEFTENGTVGDPTRATAEEGENLLEQATTALETLLSTLADRPVRTVPHK
ncbi:creatininase family protein [Halodesulfurarchaeum sp.]|uniref:creatininase family protein n=1 Tax=Halodesulfurarchaeum sp. TaxID=1980530 RepID=UPI001BC3E02A|nr:creatininase family protein [Halodesulfurarchaeum sp.]